MFIVIQKESCSINTDHVHGFNVWKPPSQRKPSRYELIAFWEGDDDIMTIGTYETEEEAENEFSNIMKAIAEKEIVYHISKPHKGD